VSGQPPPGGDEVRELVASVGPLDEVVVLLRDFLHRSGAVRAVAVVDREPGEGPAIVDCPRLAPIEVDLGDRTVYLPHALDLDATAPQLPEMHQLPPFDVDPSTGTVTSPLGGLQHLADSTRSLARALGGRNVALAQFSTTDPETPLSLTARADGSEPLVVALGEQEFELGADAAPGSAE
jgi:hypothetical protein